MTTFGSASLDFVVGGRTVSWQLLPEKAVWWAETSTLMIADLHLGKAAHFRRNGIAIPADANLENLARLTRLLSRLRPKHLLLLGDLFHSEINEEWRVFVDWLDEERQINPTLLPHLIVGNHDILPFSALDQARIPFSLAHRESGGILFTHAPEDADTMRQTTDVLHVCGHWHPGVALRGGGRQSLRLPCFYLAQREGFQQLVLPAFGAFTGLHTVRPGKHDRVFMVADKEIVEGKRGKA